MAKGKQLEIRLGEAFLNTHEAREEGLSRCPRLAVLTDALAVLWRWGFRRESMQLAVVWKPTPEFGQEAHFRRMPPDHAATGGSLPAQPGTTG